MQYYDIISQIMANVEKNKDHITIKVAEKLQSNVSPSLKRWALRWFDDNDDVIGDVEFDGNLDKAILDMDIYIKNKNGDGIISDYIDMFAIDFDEEINNYIDTYDIEEDPNFGDKIKATFTIPNIIDIMYDKVKEQVLDNDCLWLEPM